MSTPSIPPAWTPANLAPEAPATQQSQINPKRLVTASLTLLCEILAAIAAFVSWWTWSVSTTSQGSGTLYFLPGNSLSGTYSGTSSSQTYAAAGLGQVGALYEGVPAGVLVAMTLCFVAGVVALLASLGKIRNPARHSTARSLMMVPLILFLILVIAVPVSQPALIDGSDPSSCSRLSSVNSPCNSFWGSFSAAGGSSSWGPDWGWYLAITGIVLLIAAMVIWSLSADEPWQQTASAAAPAAALSPTPTVSAGTPTGKVCLRCGAYHPEPVLAFCSKCGGPVGALGTQPAGAPPAVPPSS